VLEASGIGDSRLVSLEEWSVPRYDEAIEVFGFMVEVMNFGFDLTRQVLFLEFTLVPVAEFVLGKRRILEIYLNVVEWGPGIYGAESACR
jgi:hypothetical protein